MIIDQGFNINVQLDKKVFLHRFQMIVERFVPIKHAEDVQTFSLRQKQLSTF